MKSDKTLIILDLDGTITKTDNLVQFSLFMLKKQKQRRFLFFYPLVILLKLGLIDNRKFKLIYAKWILRGMKLQSLNKKVEMFLNSEAFTASCNSKVLDFVSKYPAADKVILSANFSFLVEPIAKILNVPNQISINLEAHNGTFSGKTKGIIPYGQVKIDAVKPFLIGKNYTKTIGLADSQSDLPLLKFLDEAYLIKYDNKTKSTTFIKV